MESPGFKRLDAYSWPLSPIQAAAGIQAAAEYARGMLADAQMLFAAKRWKEVRFLMPD